MCFSFIHGSMERCSFCWLTLVHVNAQFPHSLRESVTHSLTVFTHVSFSHIHSLARSLGCSLGRTHYSHLPTYLPTYSRTTASLVGPRQFAVTGHEYLWHAIEFIAWRRLDALVDVPLRAFGNHA